jgi:hypothetical protein
LQDPEVVEGYQEMAAEFQLLQAIDILHLTQEHEEQLSQNFERISLSVDR